MIVSFISSVNIYLTSILDTTISIKKGIRRQRTLSSMSLYQDWTQMPFKGVVELKFSAMLSIIIVLDKFLPKFLRSLMA
jgi:hypothetical protein